MTNTYLSFMVGDDFFAVNVIKVLEVLQKQRITHVPNAPDYIKGIINFRGEVIPVFDTRVKFRLPDLADVESFVIIVLDLSTEGEVFLAGAVVDRVKDVFGIEDTEIKPVPTMSKEFNASFLQGIFKIHQDFIMLLDAEKVFSNDELTAIKEVNKIEEQIIN